ncbi:MAG: hypothetical protein QOJ62_1940 [Actinomycetota bacterium]|nr:hypothetical protein [Actinomycetota bacterium]
MPAWVVDYVLVHELAHLIEFGHGPRFQALVAGYPKAERARGYLLGVTDGVLQADELQSDDVTADQLDADEEAGALVADGETSAEPGALW